MPGTIAIVDDDPIYSETLKTFLEMRRHTVWRALDLAQFQAFYQGNKEKSPNLLILDMQMPGGGAPGAVKMIQADDFLKKLPIIFISGMPVDKLKEWFGHLDQNKVRYLRKPPDWNLLDQYVAELLP